MTDPRPLGADEGEPQPRPVRQEALDTETLLRRLRDHIATARPMPLSASVMVNRDELLELVEEAVSRLPHELRQARWLLKERAEFLAKAEREADDILDASRSRAAAMVNRTEVVKAADQRARLIVERAEEDARRMAREAEDFCDQKLAQFEIVLERTIKTVQAGRERLQATPTETAGPATGIHAAVTPAEEAVATAFFDQDTL